MPALRDSSELLWPAVEETIASLDIKPEDAALVKLAQRYAQIIDGARDPAWAARWLMPLLLLCLEALGATPQVRVAMAKGRKPAEDRPSGLANLRAAK